MRCAFLAEVRVPVAEVFEGATAPAGDVCAALPRPGVVVAVAVDDSLALFLGDVARSLGVLPLLSSRLGSSSPTTVCSVPTEVSAFRFLLALALEEGAAMRPDCPIDGELCFPFAGVVRVVVTGAVVAEATVCRRVGTRGCSDSQSYLALLPVAEVSAGTAEADGSSSLSTAAAPCVVVPLVLPVLVLAVCGAADRAFLADGPAEAWGFPACAAASPAVRAPLDALEVAAGGWD